MKPKKRIPIEINDIDLHHKAKVAATIRKETVKSVVERALQAYVKKYYKGA